MHKHTHRGKVHTRMSQVKNLSLHVTWNFKDTVNEDKLHSNYTRIQFKVRWCRDYAI